MQHVGLPQPTKQPITEGPASSQVVLPSSLGAIWRVQPAVLAFEDLGCECATAAWQSLSQHNYPVLQHSLAHKRDTHTHGAASSGRRGDKTQRAMSERVRATPLKQTLCVSVSFFPNNSLPCAFGPFSSVSLSFCWLSAGDHAIHCSRRNKIYVPDAHVCSSPAFLHTHQLAVSVRLEIHSRKRSTGKIARGQKVSNDVKRFLYFFV